MCSLPRRLLPPTTSIVSIAFPVQLSAVKRSAETGRARDVLLVRAYNPWQRPVVVDVIVDWRVLSALWEHTGSARDGSLCFYTMQELLVENEPCVDAVRGTNGTYRMRFSGAQVH
jgi:hypothetical protein